MSFDLHVHSNRSDGAFPPREVVGFAKEAGLEGFALTDHDTMDGYDEARAAGESLGVEVLRGCEISTIANGASVHMLAYFIDPDEPKLAEQLANHRDDRIWRTHAMVAKLNELGVAVTFDRIREIAKGGSIGRPHVAAAMVELGVIPNTVAAFTKEWIGTGGRAHVERHTLTPRDAVKLIRGAGGAAVIAHPIWTLKDKSMTEEDFSTLAEEGLAGMEVNHPDQDDPIRMKYAKMAADLGLIPTGSSDWHGNEHGGKIGCNTTERAVVEQLRERAGR